MLTLGFILPCHDAMVTMPWSRSSAHNAMVTLRCSSCDAHDTLFTTRCLRYNAHNAMPMLRCSVQWAQCNTTASHMPTTHVHNAMVKMQVTHDDMVTMKWSRCHGHNAMVTLLWSQCDGHDVLVTYDTMFTMLW